MVEAVTILMFEVPTWLGTMILSAFPIGELRFSIPVAVHAWGVDPAVAFITAVAGNFIPMIPLYFGLEKLRDITARHVPWFSKKVDYHIERGRKKLEKKYSQYGALALFLFTGLPLPLTGLWSATAAAVALKVPFKYALLGISGGLIVSGILVTMITIGAGVIF